MEALFLVSVKAYDNSMRASYVFRHAKIADGTGSSCFTGMVAVTDHMITYVGPDHNHVVGNREIDCKGMVLAPGIIDMHAHSDLHVFRGSGMSEKIAQGITTEVIGNCGMGVYPVALHAQAKQDLSHAAADILGIYDQPWLWHDFSSYADTVDASGVYTHLIGLQAHAPLRFAVLEDAPNRRAHVREIEQMCALLHQSYEQGAAGFSTGLYYAPCFFADRNELVSLLRVTAQHDRLFAVHHRCEGNEVETSLREVLELALETGVRLEISHLKAIGKSNQHKVPRLLEMIESYERLGLRVGFDQYPYTFGSTSLYSLLPPEYVQLPRQALARALSDRQTRKSIKAQILHPQGWDSIVELCGWDAITILHVEGQESLHGYTIAELAARDAADPCDVLCDVLAKLPEIALMTDITQSEESLKMILSHPLSCFGTDALYSGSILHPRSSEAVQHMLSVHRVLPDAQMIRRMTSLPAERLQLSDRGKIAVGYIADITLMRKAEIAFVMVDGKPVYPEVNTARGGMIRY
jgi:N-acyl-D-aspartate/D-glutamate deacylase